MFCKFKQISGIEGDSRTMKKSNAKQAALIILALGCVFLLGTNSWAGVYQCQILKIIHHSDSVVVHVSPGITETGFTEESRLAIKNDVNSRGMIDMVLSAAAGNMEIIVTTTGGMSWSPQTIFELTIVALDIDVNEERSQYYGPVFIETYSADNQGNYYYVNDPTKLPENAIAVRVPPHQAALTSLMTSAFMNGKGVYVAPSHRWWLGNNKLAWTIYAAKFDY